MINKYYNWISKPNNLTKSFYLLLPIIISQILQRIFPIIDSRYFTHLGPEALYIHNIQYNFITIGQFIGLATYISCLIFWRRSDYLRMQGNILIKHLTLSGLLSIAIGIFLWISIPIIINYFNIDKAYTPLATIYFKIGLCNMVLQALYGGLDGMLTGSHQQKTSMYIATCLIIANLILDNYAVNTLFTGKYSPNELLSPAIMVGLSTSFLMLLANIVALYQVAKHAEGWDKIELTTIIYVWWSEIVTYLVRAAVPLIYAYQLIYLSTNTRFLSTYQLALHISYIFCFPLIASMQTAIRDSAQIKNITSSQPPTWWNTFLYTGLIPTTLLLITGAIFPKYILKWSYDYNIPTDHLSFLPLFMLSCWIGQVGNTLTIPIRSAKKSHLVTKNFFIAELIIMLGGTQCLIYLDLATPTSIAEISILFSLGYCLLNLLDVNSLNKKAESKVIYESY